jgi:hypothetical protein
VIEDASTFRSKEQVLLDLSKGLHFSPESLEANRNGKLSKEQVKLLAPRCIQPALLTLFFLIVPISIWTWVTAGRQQISFKAAFPALLAELTHVECLLDTHGKLGGGFMLLSIIASLGMAIFMVFRLPLSLYFDLLDRKVEAREGRVVAREETINRPNGRDPIETYFFSLRYLNMPVSLAAYRAIENGSIYIIYLAPRSETLVAMEPKMEDPVPTVGGETRLHETATSTSPSKRAV